MDQTPLSFEFNEGKTYAKKGDKTIWVKEQRSGWNKRQATLQLTVHADSKPHTKPLLMFRGQERLNTKARREEVARYPKGIHVIFNPKVYANGENLKQWPRQQFKWGSPYSPSDKEPRLLVIDAFPAHKKMTDERKAQDDFIAELKKLNTTVSMVPAGATGYFQDSLNQRFNDLETGSPSLSLPQVSVPPLRMNLRSATYVTAKEAANGALDDDEYGCEDENDVTTDTNHDSEPEFDSSDDDDFDPILGGDYIAADDFIDVE
jgi:hypothetical protein